MGRRCTTPGLRSAAAVEHLQTSWHAIPIPIEEPDRASTLGLQVESIEGPILLRYAAERGPGIPSSVPWAVGCDHQEIHGDGRKESLTGRVSGGLEIRDELRRECVGPGELVEEVDPDRGSLEGSAGRPIPNLDLDLALRGEVNSDRNLVAPDLPTEPTDRRIHLEEESKGWVIGEGHRRESETPVGGSPRDPLSFLPVDPDARTFYGFPTKVCPAREREPDTRLAERNLIGRIFDHGQGGPPFPCGHAACRGSRVVILRRRGRRRRTGMIWGAGRFRPDENEQHGGDQAGDHDAPSMTERRRQPGR